MLQDFVERLTPQKDKVCSICSKKRKVRLFYREDDESEWVQHLFLYEE